MNHSEASALLVDYMEGDLPLAHRARFDAHLDQCDDCVAELEALRSTVNLLRGLPDPVTPPDLARSIMQRIEAGEAEPSAWGRIVRGFQALSNSPLLMPAAAAAASLLVLVVMGAPDGVVGLPGYTASAAAVDATTLGQQKRFYIRFQPADRVAAVRAGEGIASGRVNAASSESIAAFRVPASPQRLPVPSHFARPTVPGGTVVSTQPGRRQVGSARTPAAPTRRILAPGRTQPHTPDDWLEVLESSPAGFLRAQAALSLAERELWARELARRAHELGSARALLSRLRSATRLEVSQFVDLFAAEVARHGDS